MLIFYYASTSSLVSSFLITSLVTTTALSFKSLAVFSTAGIPFSFANAIKSSHLAFNKAPFSLANSTIFSLSNSAILCLISAIFNAEKLIFEEQVVTENNKKPDFLFPNGICYHNFEFPAEDLTILGAKTTCKDRWRQVINEADRVDERFLFTLQQGISKNQLKEMADENVKLVVPESHVDSYPEEYRESLNTLNGFIEIVKEKQDRMPKHFFV